VDRIEGGQSRFLLEGTPQTLALSPDLKIVAMDSDGTMIPVPEREPALADVALRGKVDQTVEREQPAAGHVIERCRQHCRVGFQRQGTRGSQPLRWSARGAD
jgi:hypothetical protein